eukprot:jgi/Picre1/29052/NNA_004446.t1
MSERGDGIPFGYLLFCSFVFWPNGQMAICSNVMSHFPNQQYIRDCFNSSNKRKQDRVSKTLVYVLKKVFSMGPREEEASLNNRLITFYFQPVASSHSLPQQPINNNNNDDDDDVTLTYRETDSLYDETLEHSTGATVEVVDLTGSQSESHVPCLEDDDLANYSPRTETCKENQENTAPQVAYGPGDAKRLKLLNNDSTCLFSGERCCDASPQKICPDAVKSTPMQGRLTEVSVNLGVPFARLEKSGDRVHGDAQGNSITDAPSRYAQGKKDLELVVEEKRNILHAVYGKNTSPRRASMMRKRRT